MVQHVTIYAGRSCGSLDPQGIAPTKQHQNSNIAPWLNQGQNYKSKVKIRVTGVLSSLLWTALRQRPQGVLAYSLNFCSVILLFAFWYLSLRFGAWDLEFVLFHGIATLPLRSAQGFRSPQWQRHWGFAPKPSTETWDNEVGDKPRPYRWGKSQAPNTESQTINHGALHHPRTMKIAFSR